MTKSYQELIRLSTFEQRYDYLKLDGIVGHPTFGSDRYLNQWLYRSRRWKLQTRRDVIVRDNGCDLGIIGREIFDKIIIHHINPITIEDIELDRPCVHDLNNLICTTHRTHEAIHFGDRSLLAILPKERRKGDTTLWTVY